MSEGEGIEKEINQPIDNDYYIDIGEIDNVVVDVYDEKKNVTQENTT